MLLGSSGGWGWGGCPNGSGIAMLLLLVIATTHYVRHTLQEILTLFGTQCHQECISWHLDGAVTWDDPSLIEVVGREFILPPPPHPPPPSGVPDTSSIVDIDSFIWKDLIDWNKIQVNLLELWKDQPPGTFVEVGAVDGEFMSQTLLLEKNLNWRGLLIEPDPRSFQLLRDKRRNASIANLCILPEAPRAEVFWLHHLVDDLPQPYLSLMMARSKLAFDAVITEMERGSRTYVKCVPLSTLLMAANMTRVDFLTIATGVPEDQMKIADVTTHYADIFYVKTVLIQYPRGYLLNNPYPEIPGYLYDMGRSQLLQRFYWRKSNCHLVQDDTCVRVTFFDLMEACFKYLCDGHATVWSYE